MRMSRRRLLQLLAGTAIAPTAAVSDILYMPVPDLRPRHFAAPGKDCDAIPTWLEITTHRIAGVIQHCEETRLEHCRCLVVPQADREDGP